VREVGQVEFAAESDPVRAAWRLRVVSKC